MSNFLKRPVLTESLICGFLDAMYFKDHKGRKMTEYACDACSKICEIGDMIVDAANAHNVVVILCSYLCMHKYMDNPNIWRKDARQVVLTIPNYIPFTEGGTFPVLSDQSLSTPITTETKTTTISY